MTLLQMSVGGGAMIAAIILLRALLGGRLPRRGYVLMWLTALLRLVVPFSIPSRLSAYNAALRVEALPEARAALPVAVRVVMRQALPIARSAAPTPIALAPVPMRASVVAAPGVPIAVNWPLVLYLAGALLLALLFAIAYTRQMRALGKAEPVVQGYAADWLPGQSLVRRVRLRASDALSSPLTYGLLRPVIRAAARAALRRARSARMRAGA